MKENISTGKSLIKVIFSSSYLMEGWCSSQNTKETKGGWLKIPCIRQTCLECS